MFRTLVDLRRYDLGRSVATRVLFKLSEDGIISRNRGHGWRFEPTLDSLATRDESYAFRIVVEPAAKERREQRAFHVLMNGGYLWVAARRWPSAARGQRSGERRKSLLES